MNNRFNVGDRVKVITVKKVFEKKIFIGDTFTIKTLNPNGNLSGLGPHYGMSEWTNGFVFREDELELVEANPFTKLDLKNGMIVEYSNGSKHLIINEKLFGIDSCGQLSDYSEELENVYGCEALNIDKVYSIPFVASLNYILKEADLSEYLVWDRPKSVEMTISEIERILGYPIKIVGEDKEV